MLTPSTQAKPQAAKAPDRNRAAAHMPPGPMSELELAEKAFKVESLLYVYAAAVKLDVVIL